MIDLICGKFEDIDLSKYGKFKLTFLDPPDNEKRSYDNYKDNLKTEEYIDLLEQWVIKSCIVTDGPVFISFAEKWIYEIENIIRKNTIPLIKRIYWHFTFGQNNKYMYSSCVRPIYWLNKPTIYQEAIKIPSDRQIKYKDKRAKNGGKLPSNMWDFSRICGTFKERRSWHPTQHPESLVERIVLGHSKDNDLILDPFVGSGTTAIVAKKLKRNFVGIDCSKFYLEKIKSLLNTDAK